MSERIGGVGGIYDFDNAPRNVVRSGDYDAIPPAVFAGLDRYTSRGVPTGDFLQAVISNDLKLAMRYADPWSMRALPAIVGWLYNEAPGNCWGSPKAYKEWTT